ncbi:GH17197 [Drosophila grimshawi]|uniref:GH17197 n=1 Tax=Drosophila grimshawi TaxID=7222 RepID=B4J1U3_DROGR|nr:GH17197 [Drosophila grimshawi]
MKVTTMGSYTLVLKRDNRQFHSLGNGNNNNSRTPAAATSQVVAAVTPARAYSQRIPEKGQRAYRQGDLRDGFSHHIKGQSSYPAQTADLSEDLAEDEELAEVTPVHGDEGIPMSSKELEEELQEMA